MKRKIRVIAAMSGGVDSSVAAALLQKKGFEVIGLTMCFNLPDGRGPKPSCCGLQGIEDARKVCGLLGIRHYVVSMQAHLEERVIKDFCREYGQGRTPNPCVRCNQFVKFDALLKKAVALGGRYLATGHYARVGRSLGSFYLRKGKDPRKDQSYFLYRAGQEQLSRLLFPVGGFEKARIRSLAQEFNLPVAHKPDSQEICFLPDNDYRGFLERRGYCGNPGPVVDTSGRAVGRHKGIAFYTIGQREGLGIALGYPAYVTAIHAASNTIVVGRKEEAYCRSFLVRDAHFTGGKVNKKVALEVKIRYNHTQAPAYAMPAAGGFAVTFITPQFAVTPGQSAVFYRKDRVLGGGIIEEVTG